MLQQHEELRKKIIARKKKNNLWEFKNHIMSA